MPTLFQVVMDIGTDHAASLEQRAPYLQSEILDLETKLSNKQSELDLARGAYERATQLPELLRRQIICPYCWVGSGTAATLRAVGNPSDNPSADFFRCNSCDRVFEV